MGEQYSASTFTSTSGNFTRTYRDGGASGKGVTYMMSIGWVQGCAEFASQRPDRPIDSGVEFNWEGLLKDTYYNCECSPDLLLGPGSTLAYLTIDCSFC